MGIPIYKEKLNNLQKNHETWMKKALELSKKGFGKIPGRPLVGCVIVDEKNQEIGQGYFKKIGGPHAEIIALKKSGNKAKKATMYVTLEPHCIQGLTPPCTKAIIKAGIGEIFIAIEDPFPGIRGQGIQELREAGLIVHVGLLKKEAQSLNKDWINKVGIINLKIAVIGSARSNEFDDKIKKIAYDAGKIIAKNRCILLTGGGRGIAEQAVKGATDNNGLVVGISPAANLDEHVNKFKEPVKGYNVLLFTGFGYKGRNVILIRSCDAVISINGGLGTLNELTIALDEGKYIGILRGSGGVTDKFVDYFQEIVDKRKMEGKLVINSDVNTILNIIASLKRFKEDQASVLH
jgi:uncharacterized protein (TIGR00725 family)